MEGGEKRAYCYPGNRKPVGCTGFVERPKFPLLCVALKVLPLALVYSFTFFLFLARQLRHEDRTPESLLVGHSIGGLSDGQSGSREPGGWKLMSIYIENMNMPESCGSCDFCALLDVDEGLISYGCRRLKQVVSDDHKRLDNCPLIEVNDHYDLIDHNELKIAVMDVEAGSKIDFLKHAMDCINNAPVVIPGNHELWEGVE